MPVLNSNLEPTNKALSALGGVHIFATMLDKLRLNSLLTPHLPTAKIATATSSYAKFKAMSLALVAGADSLDAIERLGDDVAFTAINGRVNAANTYGDYLREFTSAQCRQLSSLLVQTALKLRKAVRPDAKDFIVDIDSTDHEQSAKKMEGYAKNYKGHWGLDSLLAFDQFGFQLHSYVRPGNTFTANHSPGAIQEIFKQVPRYYRCYVRADAGYCNSDVFNACRHVSADFVIAMRANMYATVLGRVKHWEKAKKTSFYDGRETEIGQTVYWPRRSKQLLRVVFMRALKKGEVKEGLFNDAEYEYFAWVTNIGEHEMTNEKIIEFYRGRGNAENFIRELKHGLDLKHYPCQKLLANRAYGLIAAFAYNLLRYTGFLSNPVKPHFSKAVRFRMVNLACQVVRHARSVVLRFSTLVYEEVCHWQTLITSQIGLGSS